MKIKLSSHFSYGKILKLVAPSIAMMVFVSIYGVIDGLFVSNFVGKTPFAAVNLIMPFLMVLGALGFMIGTGGSAIVSQTLGEGDKDKANRYFSFLVYVTFILGVVLAVLGEIFLPDIALFLRADESMLPYCVSYGRIIILALPFFMLQNVFQSFFTTAEKPALGFIVTVIAGFTNIIFDAVFVAGLSLGVEGAAVATCMSQAVGALIPIVYFSRKNNSLLRIGKTKCEFKMFLKTCANGSSEFVTNISVSVVSMIYNSRLMDMAGENGVSAYGVIMYVNFIFIAVLSGYAIGIAPVIGYNYGARNNDELKNVFKKSLFLMAVFGVVLTLLAVGFSHPLAKLFVGYDESLFIMTKNALRIYSIGFIIMGFSIFGSAFFTALGNGIISALISFLRTFIFQIAAVIILPMILDLTGIWLSVPVSELFAFLITIFFFAKMRKKYGY